MSAKRDFLTLTDCSREEIIGLIGRSIEMKVGANGAKFARPLEGRSIAVMFEKASTRTRTSFEVGIHQLGGNAIFLSGQDLQLSRGEPVKDTARVLSRYVDGLVVRTFGHNIVEELAEWSSIPIINGLTDSYHPCQVLADLMTLHELGLDIGSMKAAWIGDGNNMANSWINAAKLIGFRLSLACPEGYDPAETFDSGLVSLVRDPKEAAKDADVISTDVWASMGQESEAETRQDAFRGYQVNMELLKEAKKDVYVLHCLPAHREEEITEEVLESEHSRVWDQAENRMHVQKALLEFLIKRSA
jgi:ornithine carbamoyltransferase